MAAEKTPMRFAMAIVFVLAGAPAWAGIESCEKIKDADAYNSCLAAYGPAVGEHRSAAKPAKESAAKDRHARRRGRKTQKGWRQAPRRHAKGRIRIEIYPGK